MRVIKTEARRRIAWLIAEKSMRRKFIGAAARAAGAVSVGRALDSTRPAKGKLYLPDPEHDPLLLRGVDTQFDKEAEVGGLIVLPSVNNSAASAEILEIVGPEELRLKRELKGAVALHQLTGRGEMTEDGKIMGDNKNAGPAKDYQGTSFKVAPKVDQSLVYDAVFQRLSSGECVGIFPEGGSHDRTELLPLKGNLA